MDANFTFQGRERAMIVRHKDTGLLYAALLNYFDHAAQSAHVAYMQMETGRVFGTTLKRFNDKFEVVNENPQNDIQPKVDY